MFMMVVFSLASKEHEYFLSNYRMMAKCRLYTKLPTAFNNGSWLLARVTGLHFYLCVYSSFVSFGQILLGTGSLRTFCEDGIFLSPLWFLNILWRKAFLKFTFTDRRLITKITHKNWSVPNNKLLRADSYANGNYFWQDSSWYCRIGRLYQQRWAKLV
jgi:hypothetical protein